MNATLCQTTCTACGTPFSVGEVETKEHGGTCPRCCSRAETGLSEAIGARSVFRRAERDASLDDIWRRNEMLR